MSNSNSPKSHFAAPTKIAVAAFELRAILGRPPLLTCEDEGAYQALHEDVRSAVKPIDVVDEMWARDVTDNFWEVLRLRRLKASFLERETLKHLKKTLEKLTGNEIERPDDDEDKEDDGGEPENAQSLMDDWNKGETDRVTEILKGAGLDHDMIVAQTIKLHLDAIAKWDRLITQAEVRRNMAIREMDRHRAVVARLRELANALDAECTVISGAAEQEAA